MGKRKIEKLKNSADDDLTMPAWIDCSWRRIPCEKKSCPICGRIIRDRERQIAAGKDPNSMEAALESVGNSLGETLAMIKEDSAKRGIDLDNIDDNDYQPPPRPDEFPPYNKIFQWRKHIYAIAEASDEVSSSWLYTEAGEDLLWYANTIIAKTYRQLCNRWHINEGDEFGEPDLEYTKYVLNECLSILKNALCELSDMDIKQAREFKLALVYLTGIEKEIVNI